MEVPFARQDGADPLIRGNILADLEARRLVGPAEIDAEMIEMAVVRRDLLRGKIDLDAVALVELHDLPISQREHIGVAASREEIDARVNRGIVSPVAIWRAMPLASGVAI